MATIARRKKSDGSYSYRAEIRLKERGRIVHQESRTFSDEEKARDWVEKREAILAEPGAKKRTAKKKKTLKDLLEWYEAEYKESQDWGKSKSRDIARLMRYDLAKKPIDQIDSRDLIEHIKDRLNIDGIKPQTAKNDLIWLARALKSARPHFPGVDIDLQVFEDAKSYCYDHGMIAASNRRERRPSTEELAMLDMHFWKRQHDRRCKVPIHTLFWFAIWSARRQGEITRLRWEDLNEEQHTGVVRDLKHPRKKNLWKTFKLTPQAWQIIQVQPRTSELVFPYDPKSVSSAFTNSCKFLKIENLTYHDLRHEAVSRLFEAGYSIIEVQQFSLHTEWKTLQRYTNLKPGEVIIK